MEIKELKTIFKKYKKDDLFIAKNDKHFFIFSIDKMTISHIIIKRCWIKNKNETFKELISNQEQRFSSIRKNLNFYKIIDEKEKEYYKSLFTLSELEK